jgi:hypothetical protein
MIVRTRVLYKALVGGSPKDIYPSFPQEVSKNSKFNAHNPELQKSLAKLKNIMERYPEDSHVMNEDLVTTVSLEAQMLDTLPKATLDDILRRVPNDAGLSDLDDDQLSAHLRAPLPSLRGTIPESFLERRSGIEKLNLDNISSDTRSSTKGVAVVPEYSSESQIEGPTPFYNWYYTSFLP